MKKNPVRPLTKEEMADLRRSAADDGPIVPIIVDQHGDVIDGHHRAQLETELGITWPRHTIHYANDAERTAHAIKSNMARRQLSTDDRRVLHQQLREVGYTLEAIAEQTGYSDETVRRDLKSVSTNVGTDMPATVTGKDGKTYPTRKPRTITETQPGDTIDGHTIDTIEHYEDEIVLIDTDGDALIASPDTPIEQPAPNYPTKPDLGGGISHPARFSPGMIETFQYLLDFHGADPDESVIIDPFAGPGGIHELQQYGWETIGIEIEPEWANMHPDTYVGDAHDLTGFVANHELEDASLIVITSPTYGNRLADSHNASDPERRRSYTHDLGRKVSDNSSADMQWGPQYRDFHRKAWTQVAAVVPTLFIMNIKDHIRGGQRQLVDTWHLATCLEIGFEIVDMLALPIRSLRSGQYSNRVDYEMMLVFRSTRELVEKW